VCDTSTITQAGNLINGRTNNDVFFSDEALFAMSRDSLESACNLLVALDQIRGMGRAIDTETHLASETLIHIEALRATGGDVQTLEDERARLLAESRTTGNMLRSI
jgi:hypothetical protein